MESSGDSYLHKKFKKQLTIDVRSQNNDKDIKEAAPLREQSEEKKVSGQQQRRCNPPVTDNNRKIVPNQSTNTSSSSYAVNPSSTTVKSSISVDSQQQPSNSCISHIESLPASFDTKFSDQTTNFVNSTSSILDNYYHSYPYDYSVKQDEQDGKSEETRQGEKASGSGGSKYVCSYCNMVCSKPSVLQKHIRAHTNERPYPCKSCGFSFKTRSNLYKHCRSRTHANRVLGSKMHDSNGGEDERIANYQEEPANLPPKPYKPRFHTTKQIFDARPESESRNHRNPASEMLSHHINEIISKNNSIVNSKEDEEEEEEEEEAEDQPLNLTSKNRKRAISEMSEPVTQKSLIKELLLKNLSSSDMQCPYCKMIFQTVTELDVHKYRSCKGKPSNSKYSRSSSVNVASILTQNKNAFDDIPHLQNKVFPLNSPGPFLGKTRLVETDKTKSFSFDSGNLPLMSPGEASPIFFPSGTFHLDKEKKQPIRLFGGEVKVQSSGETKSFKVDANNDHFQPESNYMEYGGKLSENRVIKSSLQSGGTMLTNKTNYNKQDLKGAQEVIRVYDKNTLSPSIEILNFTKQKFTFERQHENPSSEAINEPSRSLESDGKPFPNEYKYTNIADFSQNAVKMLTPNIKQPSFGARLELEQETENVVPLEAKSSSETQKFVLESKPLYNPLNLFVNGKVVRHVPGMPGPVVAAETPMVDTYECSVAAMKSSPIAPKIVNLYVQQQKALNDRIPTGDNKSKELSPRVPEMKLPSREPQSSDQETKKFVRPNSLALKPTTAALKQHHGLTPTMFNQILISPDTPRVEKKYAEHFLHGNYFSYLGLKSSTKPVYCTLNKTQPFYVHHFNTLSMYSEWRQQDTKQDKFYASNYDSRQKNRRYTVAGKPTANLIIHSSYKFLVSETSSSKMDKLDEQLKNCVLPGGYESKEDYTYIRGRGRGRYVCDQCGIRCKKPSMLKKHIRTHSNDRPYTCSHCNFSFKTKGNLTKHMKSKAHTKNYTASNSSGSSTQQSPHGSESDTEDSGMDSSDESTRQQEHEAAYGLLSLSQKPTQAGLSSNSELLPLPSSGSEFSISTEEVVYVSKTNYAKNKILDERNALNFASRRLNEVTTILPTTEETTEMHNVRTYLGKCNVSRPLTYPYTTVLSSEREVKVPEPSSGAANLVPTNGNEPKNIRQFHVIQKYIPHTQLSPTVPMEKEGLPSKKSEVVKIISSPIRPVNPPSGIMLVVNDNVSDLRKRKISISENKSFKNKIQKNEEVMDLSMPVGHQEKVNGVDNAVYSEFRLVYMQRNASNEINSSLRKGVPNNIHRYEAPEDKDESYRHKAADHENNNSSTVIILSSVHDEGRIYVDEQTKVPPDYDNSAMETLADVATKQVKLEKNTLAKSVASEFLKLATKNENLDGCMDAGKFAANSKDVNELIVKSEGNKSCTICAKSFNKPSQLRLHMNIHYLERPFRCDPCSVSFRTKGHLQKHERSASHHNKLSSSPALSSSEPRPFKCSDCNIAFRIHGHLAKHLRSKMHIMKLECLAKVPFGLYAELERSNSLLTEINTSDGDQCLESLKTLAKKVFINDPSKLNQLELRESVNSADR